MEFYDGKPIIYSLGNYWFNHRTLDTMLLNLHFYGDENNPQLEVSIVPALQTGYKTYYVEEQEKQRQLYDYLESVSIHVSIDDNGYITNNVE